MILPDLSPPSSAGPLKTRRVCPSLPSAQATAFSEGAETAETAETADDGGALFVSVAPPKHDDQFFAAEGGGMREGEWSRGLGCNLAARALMGKMNRSRCPGDKFNQSSLLLCNIFCLPKRPPALHDCSFHSSDRIAERSDVADFCSLKEPFRFLSCRLMTFPAKFQISPSPISSRNFGT